MPLLGGLDVADSGPERSALLVIYGDVLRQLGDRAGAADADEQAR